MVRSPQARPLCMRQPDTAPYRVATDVVRAGVVHFPHNHHAAAIARVHAVPTGLENNGVDPVFMLVSQRALCHPKCGLPNVRTEAKPRNAHMSVTANDVGWCMGHALPFSMVSMPCRGATVHALRLQLPQCEALVEASRYEYVAAGRMKPGSVDVCGWSIATHTAQVHRSFLVCRDTPGTHCAIR